MIFNYNYIFNIDNLEKFTKKKKINILDFGCGKGNWDENQISGDKINTITLYDKNANLEQHLKQKYKSSKIKINFNFNEILKYNFDIVILSSVIQYIPYTQLSKIIFDLSINRKEIIFLLTDIPFLPRFLEIIFLPFFNIKRFIFVLSLIVSKDYHKIKFYRYPKKYFDIFKTNFQLKFIKNIHDLKFLRYSVFIEKK